MVRLRLSPKRRSDLLILAGVVLLSVGAWVVTPAAGLIVAGASAVLSGLFLVPNMEGVLREPTTARPPRQPHN